MALIRIDYMARAAGYSDALGALEVAQEIGGTTLGPLTGPAQRALGFLGGVVERETRMASQGPQASSPGNPPFILSVQALRAFLAMDDSPDMLVETSGCLKAFIARGEGAKANQQAFPMSNRRLFYKACAASGFFSDARLREIGDMLCEADISHSPSYVRPEAFNEETFDASCAYFATRRELDALIPAQPVAGRRARGL